jgi:hypothetical protein
MLRYLYLVAEVDDENAGGRGDVHPLIVLLHLEAADLDLKHDGHHVVFRVGAQPEDVSGLRAGCRVVQLLGFLGYV